MDLSQYFFGQPHPVWAPYQMPGIGGVRRIPSFQLGVAHANTGGQDSSSGSEPIPPTAAGTTALGTAGVAYDGTPNASFDKIVTSLVLRNVVEALRAKAVILPAAGFIRARHVPGTKDFVYTVFGDLAAADELLEGVPPQTVGLAWDTMSFTGTQKGKVVAITDLADAFSPFDLYATAAEKVAWNAIDTAEKDAVALLNGTDRGVGAGNFNNQGTIVENIVNAVVGMKVGEVPTFDDGTYHALVSPADAAAIMVDADDRGWTESNKYVDNTPLLNGEIGKFRGVRFIETTRVADGKSVLMGPGAFVWGDYQTIQAYRVAAGGDHADPLAQRGLVGWKGMWGLELVKFSGTPNVGPTSNTKGYRFMQIDFTNVSS